MHISQLLDHHMHSEFSEDSSQSFEVLVQDAIACGKKYITVTDHSDLINAETSKYFCTDITAYDKKVEELQRKYPEITILRGTEIGYEESCLEYTKAFMDKHQFDIRILSIHSIMNGKDFADEFRTHGKWAYSDDVVKDYFAATLKGIQSLDNIQILGHVDYLFRYIPGGADYDISPYLDILNEIFAVAIEKDIALDLNTAGIRYGLPFFHPQPQILKLYKEAGGKRLALGSDAHVASDVNFGFDTVLDTLLDLGFTEITTYETGKPIQIPIALITR